MGVTDVKKAGWAGLIIYGLLPHGFLSHRPHADGAIESRPTCPQRDGKSRQEAPKPQGCVSVDLGIPSASLPLLVGEGDGGVRGLCQGPADSDFPKRGPELAGFGRQRETRHLSRRNGKGTFPFNYTASLPVSSLPRRPFLEGPSEELALLQIK